MADWNQPTNASAYTGVLSTLNEKITNAAKMDFTGDTNIPTGTIRHNSSTNVFQKWNGTTWATLVTNITIDAPIAFSVNTASNFAVSVTNSNTGGQAYGLIIDNARNDFALAVRDNTSNYRHVFDADGTLAIGQTGANAAINVNSSGEVLIASTVDNGSFNLQCNGTGVWGAGAYTNGSDEQLKEDIAPLQNSLELVEALNPVVFRYKQFWSSDGSLQPGFIAQEVSAVLADTDFINGIVFQGNPYLGLSYQNFIPLLTKAIQELSHKVQSLEARVTALESAGD